MRETLPRSPPIVAKTTPYWYQERQADDRCLLNWCESEKRPHEEGSGPLSLDRAGCQDAEQGGDIIYSRTSNEYPMG